MSNSKVPVDGATQANQTVLPVGTAPPPTVRLNGSPASVVAWTFPPYGQLPIPPESGSAFAQSSFAGGSRSPSRLKSKFGSSPEPTSDITWM